ncbi:protease pro-enzyme activation domain-containing protein [Solimonas terrae]|uniref:PKD domain-containing protein n=1 Tax=Solimonas terrae TaxID=1396819 RepID=A0A6M2BXM5_9GAMM|nr:protease pro-enzyme activation domain-containing protein [Solimonas terrae]NGY06931.1 PKD domain-containing protein [Solimonas terrae]
MHVIVSLNVQHKDQLKAFLANQHHAGSPQYGQTLTSAQTIASYSPSVAQVQSVVDYLSAQGFRHIVVSDNRLLINADVSAAAAQAAFNTRLVNIVSGGKTLRINTRDVQVPAALSGLVLGVQGLQNAIKPHTHISALVNGADVSHKAQSASAAAPALSPADAGSAALNETFTAAAFRKAYNADATPTGANTTIGIISGGSDLAQVIADLRQAETDAGLPYVPVEVKQVTDLPDPQDHSGDSEWDLDSQSATGIATNLKKVIFYNGAGLDDAILNGTNQFVTDNVAKALNISIGGCEALNVLLGDSDMEDQLYMEAMAQGQTVFVSAGDAGASCSVLINLGTPDSGPPSVEYPASSPYVVAVGGTSLFTDTDYNYVQEITWTGTGGGTSTFEPAPDWQKGIVPTSLLGLRAVPDVSMDAGFNVAVALFYSAADVVVGGVHSAVIGTSLSSPLSTGVWARIQTAHCNSYGFAAPMFYALDSSGGPLSKAAGFHDITLGTNGLWVATPGWDYTTGFGSFDITAVNAALPAATCADNTPPVAALQADQSEGDAPLAVTFDAAASHDIDGDALDYYVLNFGDNSPLVFQSTPVFPAHVYADPGTYTATLQVRDARGGTSASVTHTITVDGVPKACVAPGATLITSPAGVSSGVEGIDIAQGTDDLLSTQFAEPAELDDQLVITMTVDNLSTVLPGFRWVTYFNIAGDPDTEYYVAMVSSDGAVPVFNYGTHSSIPLAGVGDFTVLGSLNPASNYSADGVITLVLDKSALGLKTGDQLTGIISSTRISTPDDTSGNLPLGVGLTQDSAGSAQPYTLIGNDNCATLLNGGGDTTGGTTTGGDTTGGDTTGGSTTGGDTTGGTTTGGDTTGGDTTGGTTTGGDTTGGMTTGGDTTGGDTTGGDTTGGDTTGGTTTGGTTTGGTTTGGDTTGGTTTGGDGGTTGSSVGTRSGDNGSGAFGGGTLLVLGAAALARRRRRALH